MKQAAMVKSELTCTLLADDHAEVPFNIELSFRADDPCAIALKYRHDDGSVIEWTFARQLLIEGLRGLAGVGDVRVWPIAAGTIAPPGPDNRIAIRLSSPDGQATLAFDSYDLRDLVARSRAIAPEADEQAILDAQLSRDLEDLFGAHN